MDTNNKMKVFQDCPIKRRIFLLKYEENYPTFTLSICNFFDCLNKYKILVLFLWCYSYREEYKQMFIFTTLI